MSLALDAAGPMPNRRAFRPSRRALGHVDETRKVLSCLTRIPVGVTAVQLAHDRPRPMPVDLSQDFDLPRARALVAERDAARPPKPAHIGNSRHAPAAAEEDRWMSEHHHDDHHREHAERWKHDGVRVIKGDRLDPNTAQTPGMFRQAAIDRARVGAQRLWAGTVAIEPDAKTGVHHHGALESVIFVVRGRARMRWGERLEYVAEAGPGDFIFVPPYVPHQEINADPTEVLECVLVRSDNEAVVVNITDVEPVEQPESVYWVDPIHRDPRA